MEKYTKRRNLIRGYMKLEVWNLAMELFKICYDMTGKIIIDGKLKSQILNSCQLIIAEGYALRLVNEYLQFLNFSLGSSGELFTRMLGIKIAVLLNEDSFESFDRKHYEIENKLLALVKSLQIKKFSCSWDSMIHEPDTEYRTK